MCASQRQLPSRLTRNARFSSCRLHPMDDQDSVAAVKGVEAAGESQQLKVEVAVGP